MDAAWAASVSWLRSENRKLAVSNGRRPVTGLGVIGFTLVMMYLPWASTPEVCSRPSLDTVVFTLSTWPVTGSRVMRRHSGEFGSPLATHRLRNVWAPRAMIRSLMSMS